jgi:chaperonin GroES
MIFTPLGDRLAVLADSLSTERKTAGGIIVPDVHREAGLRGRVLGLGDAAQEALPTLTIGDVVFFSRYGGINVTVDGQEFILLRHDEVLGKLTDAGPS